MLQDFVSPLLKTLKRLGVLIFNFESNPLNVDVCPLNEGRLNLAWALSDIGNERMRLFLGHRGFVESATLGIWGLEESSP